jgi:endonuclease/exonuclease/phosphatase family metal-dependent hydrolase
MDVLRVASFNIRNGLAVDGRHSWPFRRAATAEALSALDAHVVGLQEVFAFQERYLRRAVGGHEVVGTGRSARRRGERCPLFVRRDDVTVVSSVTRWFSERPDAPGTRLPGASFPRIATMAVLEHRAWGWRFGVANVHLDEHHADNRVRSATLLASWLSPGLPWIVVGDFNEVPEDAALALLGEHGFRPALPSTEPGTTHDFTGRLDGPRYDHILAGPGWDVVSGRVWSDVGDGRLPSDHWPVVAGLHLDANR